MLLKLERNCGIRSVVYCPPSETEQPEVEEQEEEPQDEGQEEPSNEGQETAGPLT